jgi:hypothetical protein
VIAFPLSGDIFALLNDESVDDGTGKLLEDIRLLITFAEETVLDLLAISLAGDEVGGAKPLVGRDLFESDAEVIDLGSREMRRSRDGTFPGTPSGLFCCKTDMMRVLIWKLWL